MKLQTALENLEFHAYHGIYEEEKIRGGRFQVTVIVSEESLIGRDFSNIEQQINYELLINIVKEEMNQPRELIEDVASRILIRINSLLKNRKGSLLVKITKPDPAGLFGSGAASVCLEQDLK